MEKEFKTLSEKMYPDHTWMEKDIKEFIKILKDDKVCFCCGRGLSSIRNRPKDYTSAICSNCYDIIRRLPMQFINKRKARIDKLAGPKLITK